MKIVNCPVSHFRGHVVLHDPLTLPQVIGIERALGEARQMAAAGEVSQAALQMALLPGLMACVKEWHLRNLEPEQLTPETFPASPRLAAGQLIEWLTREVMAVYSGETEIPNE